MQKIYEKNENTSNVQGEVLIQTLLNLIKNDRSNNNDGL